MDLMKIATDPEATTLDKIAAITAEFHEGNITGEEADAFAQEIGIDPADLLAFHEAHFADSDDMEKVAEDMGDALLDKLASFEDDSVGAHLVKTALDPEATYTAGCASCVDLIGGGHLTPEEGIALGKQANIDPRDIEAMYGDVYGVDEDEDEDIEKEAGSKAQRVIEELKRANRAVIKGTGGALNGKQKADAAKYFVKDKARSASKSVKGAAKRVMKNAKKNKGAIGAGVAGLGAGGAAGYYAAQ